MERHPRPGTGKIAVLRAGGIGDLVFALPALSATRRAFPNAEITLLGRRHHRELLADRPGPVDRVVVIPTYRGVGADEDALEDSEEIEAFFAQMRRERFDIAVQMHGGGRFSNGFTLRLGAASTVGSKTPDAAELDRWIPFYYFQPEIVRCLEIVSLLGVAPGAVGLELAVTKKDLVESEQAIGSDGRPLAVLCPGAGDARRRWSPVKFAGAADDLASRGFRIVVSGNENDRVAIENLTKAMSRPSESVLTLSLGGLIGLLARASIVVGNDTGPVHLAAAVGARTVVVYWCGNVITAGCLTRLRHRPAISWRLNCPICGRNTISEACDHPVSFVDDVTVDEVLSHCSELLGSPSGEKQAAAGTAI